MATPPQTHQVEVYDELQATPAQRQTGFSYDDLQAFPEDNFRREVIDGELIVTAAPGGRHQDAVLELGAMLLAHSKQHGGKVYVAPRDVYFSNVDVVEPDVIFVRAESLTKDHERYIEGVPDVVVEVSSPSTRRLELKRKLALYEGFGVPEYWYIDLDAERVELYRLVEARYERPEIFKRGDTVKTMVIENFSITVDDLLGPTET